MKTAVFRLAIACIGLVLALGVDSRRAEAEQEVPTCAWCGFTYDMCLYYNEGIPKGADLCYFSYSDCKASYCKK